MVYTIIEENGNKRPYRSIVMEREVYYACNEGQIVDLRL